MSKIYFNLRRLAGWTGGRIRLFEVLSLITFAVGFILTIKTIDSSNRFAWRTSLDQATLELGKLAIEEEGLACVYNWDHKVVDDSCFDLIFTSDGYRKAYIYTEMLLAHLHDAREYSDRYDSGFFNDWYADWAVELADSPIGLTAYVLCGNSNCEKGNIERRLKLAWRLGLCGKNRPLASCIEWFEDQNKRARKASCRHFPTPDKGTQPAALRKCS